jgi:hypothetical protein
MASAATSRGEVICFRCRRRVRRECAACAEARAAERELRRAGRRARQWALGGLWLAGAATAGALLGALLTYLG